MINRKEEEVTETREYVMSIVCDVCGKTYSLEKGAVDSDIYESQEFTAIRFTGGYGSVFGDGTMMELDICQHCLKEKLGEYMREVGDAW